MTFDQFVSNEVNKFVDVDGAYGAQCWDIVELYAEQVLGIPREPWAITLGPKEDAYEAWTVFDSHMQKYFDKIPAGQEQRGDIIIYGPLPGDSAGHIDICLGGGQVEEQNAPYGSAVAIHSRTDYDVLGSLRFKGEDMVDDAGARLLLTALTILTQAGATPDRQPTTQEVTNLIGRSYPDALQQLVTYQGYKNNLAKVKYYDADVAAAAGAAQKKLDQIKGIVNG